MNNQMNKIEALEYLVEHEITTEWKCTAMYLKCRNIIKSNKTIFTKYELDEMLKYVENL